MADTATPLEVEVVNSLDRLSAALREKDLDALSRCYDQDVRVFDLGMQLNGFADLRALWESCFPYFPNPIGTERKDLQLSTSPDVAIATFLSRVTGMETDHPSARSWLRTTLCMRKLDGDWKIFHEHISLPVDCATETLSYIMD